ncbi:MAG: 30S ribosomal protein S8 [Chlamydiia bacterium]|nr:30S ribosomal protein S8 [Chlamydiia bacterium]MCH9618493.1 30S ribosomal protein S8 [Chlamydiia bacterium]MCH9623782.1 30S ribosomal protein S8 [Chlamydiia bacterium]
MIHDPIADMLTRIRNAIAREHRFVHVLYSKVNINILKVLSKAGFIDRVLVSADGRLIRVYLKYTSDRKSIISGIQRVSTPGRRKYVGVDNLPVLRRGLGKTVVSTSKGMMSAEDARRENMGGELICSVW